GSEDALELGRSRSEWRRHVESPARRDHLQGESQPEGTLPQARVTEAWVSVPPNNGRNSRSQFLFKHQKPSSNWQIRAPDACHKGSPHLSP
ncbi:hypothetical protein LEMLEM_LOCUS26342, partial [Lemmus lemmus]